MNWCGINQVLTHFSLLKKRGYILGKHLLWITQNYFPQRGGMAQSCDRIVTGLRRKGWSIDLVYLSSRWSETKVQTKRGGQDIRFPVGADLSHSLNELWCALPRFSNETYEGVIAFGGNLPVIAGPIFSAWIGAPLIVLIRGNDFDTAVFDPKRILTLERALLASSCAISVSHEKVPKIQSLWPTVRAEWVPNGIDLSTWSSIPSDFEQATQLRQSLQLEVYEEASERRKLLIGMFGHLKRKKGGELFLRALQSASLLDQVQLLIMGDLDPVMEETLSELEELKVHHLPFTERYELLPYYLACDFVALPSFYDGMPNVMLEAAALGIPLIASTAGGMGDVLIDGVHGFLFHPGHLEGCIKALLRAQNTSQKELNELKVACQTLVQEQLTVDLELSRYHDLLTDVITHHTRTSPAPLTLKESLNESKTH